MDLSSFAGVIMHYIKSIGEKESSQAKIFEETICYYLAEFMRLGVLEHEEIIKKLVKENQHLLGLI